MKYSLLRVENTLLKSQMKNIDDPQEKHEQGKVNRQMKYSD